jgi:apolipoprotein N-acyltransferase
VAEATAPPAAAQWLARWPRLCALALGVVSALGFAPLGIWVLTLLGLWGLFALIQRAERWQQAAGLGWCFGLGHFALGNVWIATAFGYQANMPAWLGSIAVLLIAAYLALFPALAVLAAWLARRHWWSMVLALAGAWVLTEWLRSWLFTGYPWNPLGAVLLGDYHAPGLARLAPYLGTYGLAGVVILLAGLLGWPIVPRIAGRRGVQWAGLLTLLAIYLAMGWNGSPSAEPRAGPRFTLVQPDVRQEQLNDPANFETQFARQADLSRDEQPGTPRLVFWPESGVPDYLRPGYPSRFYGWTYDGDPDLARQRIGRVIGPRSLLLTGTSDLELRGAEAVGARNVVTAIDGTGAIKASYAKAHLVPGGEYLPLRWLLEPLGAARLVPGSLDYWPGPGPRTLDLGVHGRVGVQICYEIIFSGRVTDRANRPAFLFNPSNDGWFGAWGPPQHLAQARLRAIEEGLPVLRATTTGISAVIDAQGVVRRSIARHEPGRIDGIVPPALPATPFARFGNRLPLIWAMVLLSLCLVALRRAAR